MTTFVCTDGRWRLHRGDPPAFGATFTIAGDHSDLPATLDGVTAQVREHPAVTDAGWELRFVYHLPADLVDETLLTGECLPIRLAAPQPIITAELTVTLAADRTWLAGRGYMPEGLDLADLWDRISTRHPDWRGESPGWPSVRRLVLVWEAR